MSLLATIPAVRPEDSDFVLFIHILGALTLVGAVTLALSSLAAAWSNGSATMMRLSFRSLLWAALPAWIVMRVGGELIAEKEGLNEEGVDLAWLNIGYMAAEPTLLLLLISIFLAWRGTRNSEAQDGAGRGMDRVATVLVGISLIAFLVAIWAMTTKPT